jgi:PPOX class probable F420-dependent enzyme
MAEGVGDLGVVQELIAGEKGLASLAVSRPDGTVQATVVNAGLLESPFDRTPVVGVVVRSAAAKVRFLRRNPYAAVTFRVSWRWATVEGSVTLVGPDDPQPGVDAERLRLLLREVYVACGGAHDDFEEFDRVMAAERRLVVLVSTGRILTNG